MNGVVRLLGWLGRHAAPMIAASVFVGLLAPPLAAFLRPVFALFVILPLMLALMRIDWGMMAAYLRRPAPVVLTVAWLLAASPLIAWLALAQTALPDGLKAAVALMAAAAPIGSAAAFGLILGLDAAFIVVATTAATLVMPFTMPPLALALLEIDVNLGLAAFLGRLIAVVGGVFLAALALRRLAGPVRLARHAATLDGVSVLSLACFAIGIMDGVTEVILERPAYGAQFVLVAFAANLGLQALGALLFLPGGRLRALSAALMSGNRNMGLVLTVLADRAGFDVIMYFALAQIPMYVLPAMLLPLFRRVLPS